MEKSIKPIHLAARFLDPNSQGYDLNSNDYLIAMKFIHDMGTNFNINVMVDLANYKAREGIWGNHFIWSCIEDLSPCTWWKSICATTELKKIAIRILTAPCTSDATERSFSTHSFIHSKKRNRLTADNAGKVCFVAHNWNLSNKNVPIIDSSQQVESSEKEISNSSISFDDIPSTSTGISHFSSNLHLNENYLSSFDSDSSF